MKTIAKGPFLGINNRLPDFALQIKTPNLSGDYLREAVNVDIDDARRIRRRKATALIQAMTGAHSLYTATNGTRYLVRDSVLYTVTLPAYTETLFKVLTSNAAMSYVDHGATLYYSNGTDSGRISGGVWYPLALPTPDAPTVTGIAGALYKGRYQVVVSYCRMSGSDLLEEGGCSPVGYCDLATDGGLRVTIPAATTGATHAAVYVSTVNGSVPMCVATVALGTATLDVTLQSELAVGRDANQRNEEPLPAGKLFLFNGMLCSYSGSDVYEGIPAKHGYYVPLTERELEGGRMPFPASVTNVVPNQNGVFVVADKTYWFPGTRMTKAELVQDVLPYGGVPGTAFALPDKTLVGWFGAQGIVIGTPSGEVKAAMADNIDLTPPASGISAIFTSGGYRRVVSCGWCLNLENLSATTYADYDFTSISGTYGTKADGIYDLAATGSVDAHARLGRENFGTEAVKGLPVVFLGAESEAPLQLTVGCLDRGRTTVEYAYESRSGSGEGLAIQRIDPGKGLRSTWYDMTISNTEGAEFTLATASFGPVASNNRRSG